MKCPLLALLGGMLFVANGEYESINFSRTSLEVGDFVDSEACYSAIEDSVIDKDGDRRMDPEAYVDFVIAYGPTNLLEDTVTFEELPLLLINNFYLLACLCKTEDEDQCCVGPKAGIETTGVFSGDTPTDAEQSYLFLVCSQTSTAIDRVIQSMPPSEVPIKTLGPSVPPTMSPIVPSIVEEVVVTYSIGIEANGLNFEDYAEELISAMDSMAPTLIPEVGKTVRRTRRRLQTVFLPTSITNHMVVGKINPIVGSML